MDNEFELYELFNKYKYSELSDKELKNFEERMQFDLKFKEEYENFLLADKVVMSYKLYKVKDELDKFDYKGDSKGGNWLLIGLIVALVGISTGLYMYFSVPAIEPVSRMDTPVIVNEIGEQGKSLQLDDSMPVSPQSAVSSTSHDQPTGISTVNSIDDKPLSENIAGPVETKSIKNEVVVPITVNSLDKAKKSQESNTLPMELNNCIDSHIEIQNLQTLPSCDNKKTGEIIIGQIVDGNKPFKYYLNNAVVHVENNHITKLKPGSYSLQIVDAKNCKSKIQTVDIEEIECKVDFSIQPDNGIYWEPPLRSENQSSIVILNKSGVQVFTIKSSKNAGFTWTGVDNYGAPLEAGIYFYNIIDESNDIIKGTITVIR